MLKNDIDEQFNNIKKLVSHIEKLVPPSSSFETTQLRAELSGLLVVSIAARYENCVKEILIAHAHGRHKAFGEFAARNFKKINSKIKVDDLKGYCELYDSATNKKFTEILKRRKEWFMNRAGRNIESSYNQILNWRHAYAHTSNLTTTIEEVIATHRVARYVIYSFSEALHL